MTEFRPVSKDVPCEICGKPDWCRRSPDGCVECHRSSTEAPGFKLLKVTTSGFGLYRHEGDNGRSLTTPAPKPPARRIDFAGMSQKYQAAVRPEALDRLSKELGVSIESLHRLGIGHDGQAWTFPMVDGGGFVVGIRRRLPNGKRLSALGGHDGLFVPDKIIGELTEQVMVCEGPTDTAAMLDLGFAAIGRPSCSGGVQLVCELCKGRNVIIAADADKPGRDGAATLASDLLAYCPLVKIITPPDGMKDARAWRQAGASATDVQRLIDAAPVVEMINDHEIDNADSMLEWRLFPTDLLPNLLRRFVAETADAIGCDAAFVALPVLAVVGGAIAMTREVELKASWAEPPIIWGSIIARSGTLKSPALDAVTLPLRRMQAEALRGYQRALQAHNQVIVDAKSRKTLPPDPPTARRFMVSDCTIESLAPILEKNPRGLILVRDELSAWLGSFNQYKARGRGADSASWLELHRAGTLIVDRKGADKPTIYVPRAAVSVVGTIQPGIIAALEARTLTENTPRSTESHANRQPMQTDGGKRPTAKPGSSAHNGHSITGGNSDALPLPDSRFDFRPPCSAELFLEHTVTRDSPIPIRWKLDGLDRRCLLQLGILPTPGPDELPVGWRREYKRLSHGLAKLGVHCERAEYIALRAVLERMLAAGELTKEGW